MLCLHYIESWESAFKIVEETEANTFIFSSGITEKLPLWVRSLVWWSVRLITGWSSVQIRPGPHPSTSSENRFWLMPTSSCLLGS
jgi:hypothetical protein